VDEERYRAPFGLSSLDRPRLGRARPERERGEGLVASNAPDGVGRTGVRAGAPLEVGRIGPGQLMIRVVAVTPAVCTLA